MNNYPSWWNTTITVYNKYEDPTTRKITWYRHTCSNCFWKYTGDKVVVGSTTLETNSITCRVPKDDDFTESYLWNALTDKTTKFTFSPGDIVIKGTVTDTINEYTSGQRSSDLLKKYKNLQGCMTIESFTINTDGGRCNEHYRLRGI